MYGSPMTNNFTMFDVTSEMSVPIGNMEQQMNQALQALQNNPAPTTTQLATFQAQQAIWSSIVQMESSITKVMGDTMKQVVTNMGS